MCQMFKLQDRMDKMNNYIERVLNDTKMKNSNEPEFLQAVGEVLETI